MMKVALLFALCVASATAVEEGTHLYNYGKSYKAGEWSPPPPPKKESPHLGDLDRIPPPTEEIELAEGLPAPKAGARKLLSEDTVFLEEEMSGGEAAGMTMKVPHNWFGTGKYVAPRFSIATGKEECDVCKKMISAGAGPGVGKAGGEASANANMILCQEVGIEYTDMVRCDAKDERDKGVGSVGASVCVCGGRGRGAGVCDSFARTRCGV